MHLRRHRATTTNEKHKCGFQGPRWHPDPKGHFRWCMSISRGPNLPDSPAWAERDARNRMLKNCPAPDPNAGHTLGKRRMRGFTRTWDTRLGTGKSITVVFTTQGNQVRGQFTNWKGDLQGTLEGDTLNCRANFPEWKEKGSCRLTLNKDRKSFVGELRLDSNPNTPTGWLGNQRW